MLMMFTVPPGKIKSANIKSTPIPPIDPHIKFTTELLGIDGLPS